MAKRFTDTDKYKKPFIRSLPGAYKLLWDYLYHECDHAGIWIVDFEIAQIYLGKDMQVDRENALKFFNKDEQRVIEFSDGKKWLIMPFIYFQYGELNPQNRVHNSVISRLKKENMYQGNKGLIRGLQDPMDKDKDKDMEKDKDRPSKKEVVSYFKEKGFSIELAEKFYNYYNEPMEDRGGRVWKDQNGKTVKSWKQKALAVWMKDDNKQKEFTPDYLKYD